MNCRIKNTKKLSVFSDPTDSLVPIDYLNKDSIVKIDNAEPIYGINNLPYVKIKYKNFKTGYVYKEGLEEITK